MEGRSDKSIVSTLHCLKNSNHCVVIQENVLVHRKYTLKYSGVKAHSTYSQMVQEKEIHTDAQTEEENMQKSIKQMGKVLIIHESG